MRGKRWQTEGSAPDSFSPKHTLRSWQIAYGLAMAAVAIMILPVVVVLLMAGIFG